MVLAVDHGMAWGGHDLNALTPQAPKKLSDKLSASFYADILGADARLLKQLFEILQMSALATVDLLVDFGKLHPDLLV